MSDFPSSTDILDALRLGGQDDEHWFQIGKQAADEIVRLRAAYSQMNDAFIEASDTAQLPDDDCACGGGDISGHDTGCPYYAHSTGDRQ